MSWNRYLVHLSVLCILGMAAAFAYPFEGIVDEGATYRAVGEEDRSSAGVVDVQQQTVQQQILQLEAELRAMKRAYRELDAQESVAAPAMTFHQQWLDVEQEMRLLQEDRARFLVAMAAREAHAAAECLELP